MDEHSNPSSLNSTPIPVADKALTSEAHSAVHKIEFQPYLEAVIKSGERTRSTIYLIVFTMIAIFFTMRVAVAPDPTSKRLATMQKAYGCWKTGDTASAGCKAAEEYADHLNLSLMGVKWTNGASDPTDERVKEFQKQIEIFMQKRTDLHSLQLPIVGVPLDINDLWLISGCTLTIMLFVLRLSLAREMENISIARSIANEEEKQLLVMAQVLSTPPKNVRAWTWVVPVIFSLPTLFHLIVIAQDIETFHIAQVLETIGENGIEYTLECISLILVAFLSWTTYLLWVQHNASLDEIPRDPGSDTAPKDNCSTVLAVVNEPVGERNAMKSPQGK